MRPGSETRSTTGAAAGAGAARLLLAWIALVPPGAPLCALRDGGPEPRAGDGSEGALPAAPPQRPVAGMAGFASRSRLTPLDEPPVALHVVAVFPERLRINRRPLEGPDGARSIEYRFGRLLYCLDAGLATSRALQGEERDEALRLHALRLAAMLWPDGFAWSGSGEERSVELGGPGTLVARLDPSGHPLRLEARDARGRSRAALDGFAWMERQGRTWPSRMVWWRGASRSGVEVLESVETAVGYVDAYFVPRDRRARRDATTVLGANATVAIPAHAERRVEFEPADWEVLTRTLGRRIEVERGLLREAGLAVRLEVAVELDDRHRPAALLLRAEGLPDPPPAGWIRRPPRTARARLAAGLAGIGAALTELRRELPAGTRPEAAHVRWQADGSPPAIVQVVQPLPPP